MFMTSHLDQPHHTLVPTAYHGGNALAGMGEDLADAPSPTTAPTSPAPIALVSPKMTNLLLIGGIALVIFLVLRAQAKK